MLFSLGESSPDSFFRISGKTLLFDNKLMKIISKKISTGTTSMPVIYSEKGAPGPLTVGNIGLGRWLENVQNDRYSIFVIVSD